MIKMNEDLNDPTREKCPTCKGKKGISFKYYHVTNILDRLINIKKDKYVIISSPIPPAFRLTIPCQFCGGTGYIDWIRNITHQSYKRPSWSVDGCLQILFCELYKDPNYTRYSANPNYHSNKKISNLPHLIDSSQERFFGLIKLDESFLKMGLRELNSIRKRVHFTFYKIYPAFPKISVPTEKDIENVLDHFGLSQYKPDNDSHLIK
jgi:predicted transcriptional regulator with HTH domain